MHVDEFLKKENREALAKELTKEGLFELKEETIGFVCPINPDECPIISINTLATTERILLYIIVCFLCIFYL